MAATKEDVLKWIEYAKKNNYDYVISVCDTFDYSDYPVYCMEEDLSKKSAQYNGTNMQKINEIIAVSK